MHIPDGFCSMPVSLGAAAISLGALGVSVYKVRRDGGVKNSVTATAAGVVFGAQMLNFPIGSGTSGHFLGALAMAAIMGPYRAFLVILSVLAVQAFAFADGGISALGVNVLNMGVIGGFGGYALLRGVMHFLPKGRAGYLSAVGVASWFSVIMASVACALELALSGVAPFSVTLPAMAGTHALIGVGEALISCAVVGAVAYSGSDLLPQWSGGKSLAGDAERPSVIWPVALTGVGMSFFMAALLSPFASSAPDGLEKVAEVIGFSGLAQTIWSYSPLPDYTASGIGSNAFSTSLAGCAGVAMVLAVCYLIMLAIHERAPVPAAE